MTIGNVFFLVMVVGNTVWHLSIIRFQYFLSFDGKNQFPGKTLPVLAVIDLTCLTRYLYGQPIIGVQ